MGRQLKHLKEPRRKKVSYDIIFFGFFLIFGLLGVPFFGVVSYALWLLGFGQSMVLRVAFVLFLAAAVDLILMAVDIARDIRKHARGDKKEKIEKETRTDLL